MNLSSPMPLATVNDEILTPALFFLGAKYDSFEARLFLLTVGQQESRFMYRRQMNNGPATGFWQFERGGGVRGVLNHHSTADTMLEVCEHFSVSSTSQAVWEALEENDLLAACVARLLAYTSPQLFPERNDPAGYWEMYLDTWRPGKPHERTWAGFFENSLAVLNRSS